MEKRLLLAVVLSAAVLVVWNVLFPPPKPPRPSSPPEVVDTAPTPSSEPSTTPTGSPPTALDALPDAAVAPTSAVDERTVVVGTSEYEVALTNRGGRLLSWRLLHHPDDHGEPLELIPTTARSQDHLPLELALDDLDPAVVEALNRQALFEVEESRDRSGPRIRLVHVAEDGLAITKTLTFADTGYFNRLEVEVSRNGVPLSGWVRLGPGFGAAYARGSYGITGGRAIGLVDGSLKTTLASAADDGELMQGGQIAWAGLDDSFFAGLVLPDKAMQTVRLRSLKVEDPAAPKDERELVGVEIPLRSAPFRLYVGPKSYEVLGPLGEGLDAAIFGTTPIISGLTEGLFLILQKIYGYVGNYGVAIILMTIAIRLLFFPLMQRSMKSMRQTQEKMKVVQPKMKKIQERYRKTRDAQKRQALNQEMMKLYQDHGINPMSSFGGCLPMFLQLPIFFAFYRMLSNASDIRNASFLHLDDLSAYDPTFITPILMGVTMYLQQKMAPSAGMDPSMRRMMMMMPLVFAFIMAKAPSGLVLYWMVSNVLGIGQQYLVNRSPSSTAAVVATSGKAKQKGPRKAVKENA